MPSKKGKAHETVTLPDLEIFQTGTYNGDPYTLKDLNDMIAAAPSVGFRPTVKLGHMGDKETATLLKAEGMPAFGYIDNLRVKGKKLLADFVDVPKRLAEIIKKKGYSRVSSEIYWNYKKGASVFPRVLKAVALLGAEIPAITDLKDVEALYHKDLDAGTLCAYDDAGNQYRAYLSETYSYPPKKTKEAVNYRVGQGNLDACRTCRFYVGLREPEKVSFCSLVEGEIAAEAICDLFEISDAFVFPGDGDEPTVPDLATDAGVAVVITKDHIIRKKGDKYCLIAKADGEELGCHDTKADAEKQEAAIKAKETVADREIHDITLEEMKALCPGCAKQMEQAQVESLKVYDYDPAGVCGDVLRAGEKPPTGWFEACITRVKTCHVKQPARAASSEDGQDRPQDNPQNGGVTPGAKQMDLQKQIDELKATVEKKDAEILELKKYQDGDKETSERVAAMAKENEALKLSVVKLEEQNRAREADGLLMDLKRQGKLTQAATPWAKMIIMSAMSEPREYSFSENGEQKKIALFDVVKKFFEASAQIVPFGEFSKGEDNGSPARNTGETVSQRIGTLVRKYQDDHPEYKAPEKYRDVLSIVLDQHPDLKKQYAAGVA